MISTGFSKTHLGILAKIHLHISSGIEVLTILVVIVYVWVLFGVIVRVISALAQYLSYFGPGFRKPMSHLCILLKHIILIEKFEQYL